MRLSGRPTARRDLARAGGAAGGPGKGGPSAAKLGRGAAWAWRSAAGAGSHLALPGRSVAGRGHDRQCKSSARTRTHTRTHTRMRTRTRHAHAASAHARTRTHCKLRRQLHLELLHLEFVDLPSAPPMVRSQSPICLQRPTIPREAKWLENGGMTHGHESKATSSRPLGSTVYRHVDPPLKIAGPPAPHKLLSRARRHSLLPTSNSNPTSTDSQAKRPNNFYCSTNALDICFTTAASHALNMAVH